MAWNELGTACCVSSAEGHPIQHGKDIRIQGSFLEEPHVAWILVRQHVFDGLPPSTLTMPTQQGSLRFKFSTQRKPQHFLRQSRHPVFAICLCSLPHRVPHTKAFFSGGPWPSTPQPLEPCANTLEVYSTSLPKTPHLPTLTSEFV